MGWSTAAADDAWFVKGRVLFANEADGNLYELGDVATSVEVLTNPGDAGAGTTAAESRWYDVAQAGDVILVAHGSGVVYMLGLDDTAALIQVGSYSLPGGERPISLSAGAGGVLLVGTDVPAPGGKRIGRLWRGFVEGTSIVNLQLLREWVITDAVAGGEGAYGPFVEWHLAGPSRFARIGDDAFFAASASMPGHETTLLDGGIWRYHFATAGLTREADWLRSDTRRPRFLTAVSDTLIASSDGVIVGTEGGGDDRAWVERSRADPTV